MQVLQSTFAWLVRGMGGIEGMQGSGLCRRSWVCRGSGVCRDQGMQGSGYARIRGIRGSGVCRNQGSAGIRAYKDQGDAGDVGDPLYHRGYKRPDEQLSENPPSAETRVAGGLPLTFHLIPLGSEAMLEETKWNKGTTKESS